jgi:guanylate kinase
MNVSASGRLIILSGPSCAGKSPLGKALARLYPEHHAHLQKLVLYNSRTPRPGERDGVDYHFRPRQQIEALRADPRFAVHDVRGDLQALNLPDLADRLKCGDVFFEGNPFVGRFLLTPPLLAGVRRLSVFLAPLSREEILELKDSARRVSLPEFVADVIRHKLLRRTRRQKGELALPDLEDIEQRAGSAYKELKEACAFDYVIPNHDGEDSENWDAFYWPLGDARKALQAFVALLEDRPAPAEKWEPDLLP